MRPNDFLIKSTFTRKWICQKAFFNESMAAILNGLNDKSYHDGSLFSIKAVLKQAKKTELILIESDNTLFIIKHYRIANLIYQIRRLFFQSRAARNWKNAQLLLQWGIATPAPVAYIERRFSFLRRESFYIMQYLQGQCLCEVLPQSDPKRQAILAEQIIHFLKTLHQKGFIHGDMKCTNMLVIKGKVFFLDLDAMRFTLIKRRHKIDKDYRRFLKNWLKEPALFEFFEKAFFPSRSELLLLDSKPPEDK